MSNKYVVIKNFTGGCDTLFIFPVTVGHDEFVSALDLTRNDVLGAGFISISDDETYTQCYGESISLRVKSRPEDTYLLRRMFQD